MKQYTQNYQGFEVRCVEDENKVIWFAAKDIVAAVGADITNISKAISHIPSKWSTRYLIPTAFGDKNMQCLSEEGVNFYLFRSDKPKALHFQEWLAGEVLPALRKTGAYIVGEENMTEDQMIFAGYTALMRKCTGLEAQVNALQFTTSSLEQKVTSLEPKGDFYDAVNHAVNAIDFKTFAGMLISQATKKPYGRNTLLKDLRNNGILNAKNQPYQQYSHYFDVVTATKNNMLVTTTYVKPNGVTFISGKLKSIGLAA